MHYTVCMYELSERFLHLQCNLHLQIENFRSLFMSEKKTFVKCLRVQARLEECTHWTVGITND